MVMTMILRNRIFFWQFHSRVGPGFSIYVFSYIRLLTICQEYNCRYVTLVCAVTSVYLNFVIK